MIQHARAGDRLTIHTSQGARTVPANHPKWDAILDLLASVNPANPDALTTDLLALCDFEEAVMASIISDRFTYSREEGARFDGLPIDTSLSRHIVRLLNAGEDATPVVKFMERLALNPAARPRHRLFDWLRARDFTITADGHFVAYKGVRPDGFSIWAGHEPVSVDGQVHIGHIPNPVGATVSMDRELVDPNPDEACSRGLHVGTFDYANRHYNQGRVLTVLVDPADVVTVPRCEAEKMRVRAYTVQAITDAAYPHPLWDDSDDDADPWTDESHWNYDDNSDEVA